MIKTSSLYEAPRIDVLEIMAAERILDVSGVSNTINVVTIDEWNDEL